MMQYGSVIDWILCIVIACAGDIGKTYLYPIDSLQRPKLGHMFVRNITGLDLSLPDVKELNSFFLLSSMASENSIRENCKREKIKFSAF